MYLGQTKEEEETNCNIQIVCTSKSVPWLHGSNYVILETSREHPGKKKTLLNLVYVCLVLDYLDNNRLIAVSVIE